MLVVNKRFASLVPPSLPPSHFTHQKHGVRSDPRRVRVQAGVPIQPHAQAHPRPLLLLRFLLLINNPPSTRRSRRPARSGPLYTLRQAPSLLPDQEELSDEARVVVPLHLPVPPLPHRRLVQPHSEPPSAPLGPPLASTRQSAFSQHRDKLRNSYPTSNLLPVPNLSEPARIAGGPGRAQAGERERVPTWLAGEAASSRRGRRRNEHPLCRLLFSVTHRLRVRRRIQWLEGGEKREQRRDQAIARRFARSAERRSAVCQCCRRLAGHRDAQGQHQQSDGIEGEGRRSSGAVTEEPATEDIRLGGVEDGAGEVEYVVLC